jgi:hypothetical protein
MKTVLQISSLIMPILKHFFRVEEWIYQILHSRGYLKWVLDPLVLIALHGLILLLLFTSNLIFYTCSFGLFCLINFVSYCRLRRTFQKGTDKMDDFDGIDRLKEISFDIAVCLASCNFITSSCALLLFWLIVYFLRSL